ncbi:MAG: polysaccharide lyase family 8 super-sandwich domain-containing protein, partial [Oscillospiraceae bacterium]
TMVQSAYSEGNPLFGNVELKANIAKALEFWANGKIVDSDNWWHKEIGIPNIIVDILLLQPEEVNGEISDLLNAQALEGSIFKEKITDRITERPVKSSGGNLTDKLVTSMKIAVATKNAEELYKVIQLTENELRVFMKIRADEFGEDAEGIKADYSFHQHVDQVQFGGYGEVFVSGINQILKATAGTAFMVSDRALNEYANFILDGMQWSFKGEYKDFTTTGRGFSRQNGNKGIYKPVKAATEILLNYKQLDRYDELETLYKNRCSDNGDKFTGNRQFWLSDYMSHNRDDYHVGIKLASSRTKLGEVINKENLLGYYLSDGVTAIMPTGNEYENIYPLWDWNKIPGTTTPQGGLKKLEDWADWNGEHLWDWKGNRNFVGGVSDGKYGAAVMDYSRDGLDAKKSWFMFDDEMVALGNEINSYTDMNIYTNINQTTRVGDVVMGKNGKISKVSDGTTNTKDADFIWNNGVGYVAKDAEVTLENRTGKWSTINGGNKEGTETKDIFQMGLNHGVKPNNGKYEYRVVFGNTAEEMTEYVKNNPIKVLRNDDKVQAVYNSDLKMVQAVFLKTDTLTLPTGMTIYSNKKCMLMATENSDGSITMTVSNPANEAKDLQITVNKTLPILNSLRMVNGEGTTKIMFRLNEGVYAGSSTTYDSRTGFDENSIMQLDKENINK